MPLQNYNLRVAGAAPKVEEYREPLREAAETQDRLAVEEAPSRPHEIAAQLQLDVHPGTPILKGALQSPEDLEAWETFLAGARPRGALELGTASGVFSKWLSKRVEWFRTLDIGKPSRRTPGFARLDILGNPDAVRDLISQAPRPFVLYCDNGNKRLEVQTFGPSLRAGDFLVVHDLGTEVFPEDVPPNFAERLTYGLTGFYEQTVAAS